MKKLKRLIIIFIVLLLIIYVINVIRNMFILSKLEENMNKLDSINVFSFIIKMDGKEVTKITKKDEMLKIEEYDKKIVKYFNSETKEYIIVNLETGEKNIFNNQEQVMSVALPKRPNIYNNILISLKNIITTTTIDEKECYKIKVFENGTYYISSKEGLLLKSEIKDDHIYEYNEYNINKVDDSEFEILMQNN